MRLTIITIILLVASNKLAAVELFGLELMNSTQDQLRDAAKKAGVVRIRESDESSWFDSYDSSDVLPGSSRLYLGFVRQDSRFAFAEYEFVGYKYEEMLARLKLKYGSAKIIRGKFISDNEYLWLKNGIEITFKFDWQSYKTRLSYVSPDAFRQLKLERLTVEQDESTGKLTQDVSVY